MPQQSSHRDGSSQDALRIKLTELVTLRSWGGLSDESLAELNTLVTSNETARRLYFDIMLETAALGRQAGLWRVAHNNEAREAALSLADEVTGAAAPAFPSRSDLPMSESRLTLTHEVPVGWGFMNQRTSLRWFGFAATVAVLCWAGLAVWVFPELRRPSAAINETPASIGRLVEVVDCIWEGTTQPTAGDPVLVGTFALVKGTAELLFDNGVRLVIDGPTRVELQSPEHSSLQVGSLWAEVPQRASGYTVETPTITVVDLGTEFGVEVNEFGATDVQVAKGKVELRAGGQKLHASSTSPITLLAGEARRIEPAGSSGDVVVREIAASPGRFARNANATGIHRIVVGGALASSCFSEVDLSANNLINGSGLTKERHCATSEGQTMWHSEVGKVKNEYVLFDLARPYRLESMKVWNYNVQYLEMYRWRGVKQADIYVSNGSKGTPLDHPEEWTLVAENVQFEPATGTPEYDTPQIVPLKNAFGRFVAIVIDEALGHDPRGTNTALDLGDLVGLSEVQFFGVRVDPPKKDSR